MRIATSTSDGVTLLEVTGEVDLANADQLRDAAIAALTPSGGTLRIDLAGVTFMDSMGLAALVMVYRHAGSQRVLIENPQPNVQGVFTITGLDRVFESRDGETDEARICSSSGNTVAAMSEPTDPTVISHVVRGQERSTVTGK
jgi:anti-sigma B factor antagonist